MTNEGKKFDWNKLIFFVFCLVVVGIAGYWFGGGCGKEKEKLTKIDILSGAGAPAVTEVAKPAVVPVVKPDPVAVALEGLDKIEKKLDKEYAELVKRNEAKLKKELAMAEAAKKRSEELLAAAEARAKALVDAMEAADAAAKAADASVSRNLVVTGVITGGGGTSASENYRVTGKVVVVAPDPVVNPPVAVPAPEVVSSCQQKEGARYLNVTPRLNGDLVFLPDFPAGATLLDVELYDDRRGIPTRHLGPVQTFNIESGAGFNFVWRDAEGHRHYQLVNEGSWRLLAGTGLEADGSYIDPKTNKPAFKYLRP